MTDSTAAKDGSVKPGVVPNQEHLLFIEYNTVSEKTIFWEEKWGIFLVHPSTLALRNKRTIQNSIIWKRFSLVRDRLLCLDATVCAKVE
ncbi:MULTISPECIES: hypothetical protein [Acidithrix]|uniref:Uncharacterized protein n=1 Tax=Acidithrix ferrooxidans TaxID=1280514 RepID=A0A0D8HJW3_9ACTN|nr:MULTISPECIES: hypothetical protein [Acidithrix]KJF18032.1 hypothetical protein AXFE_11300 [Acidithrix ferrooxidans]